MLVQRADDTWEVTNDNLKSPSDSLGYRNSRSLTDRRDGVVAKFGSAVPTLGCLVLCVCVAYTSMHGDQ